MSESLLAKYKGPAFIILAAMCWSTTGTSQALAPEGATPYVIGGLRLWLGCFFLFLLCFFTKTLPDLKTLPKKSAFLSAMGVLFFQMLFFASVSITGVAVGTAAVCGLSPIMAGLFAAVFLKERPAKIWYIATLVAISGIALLAMTEDAYANPLGLLLAVLAACAYAVYAVFAKRLSGGNPAAMIMILFAIGSLFAWPVFFLFPTDWIFTPRGIAVSLHLGLIATALGYTCYLTGLKTTPVATAATLNLSESIAAACWGVFILHEQLYTLHITGMALILASTLVLTLRPK